MQVTVVSLIQNKPPHLAAFLDECKKRVRAVLPTDFREYDTAKQIHATIVGLERLDANKPAFHNKNFQKRRLLTLEMDYAGLLDYYRTSGVFPMQVQIGGFHNRDYPFTSRNERPYFRSFSIQPGLSSDGRDVEFVVVMGWPLRGEPSTAPNPSLPELIQEASKFPRSLDSLRRSAQAFNVLYLYHGAPTDVDNDFFFRIGMIDNPKNVDANEKRQLIHTMRNWLAGCCPVIVDVKLSDVWVTQYERNELPPDGTTNAYPIDDPMVNASFVHSLY
jgi:hypothetical protein